MTSTSSLSAEMMELLTLVEAPLPALRGAIAHLETAARHVHTAELARVGAHGLAAQGNCEKAAAAMRSFADSWADHSVAN